MHDIHRDCNDNNMRVFNNKHIGRRALYVALVAFFFIYNISNRPNIYQYNYTLNIERL